MSIKKYIAKVIKEERSRLQCESFFDDIRFNDVVQIDTPKKHISTISDLNVPDYFPEGYFLVVKPFRIDYGGAWRMTFNKGSLIFSNGSGYLESTSPELIKKAEDSGNPFLFKPRRPPISGRVDFKVTDYGVGYDQKQVYNSFANSVKSISGKEALEYIKKFLSATSENVNEIKTKLRELEVTDPDLQKKIQDMARLSDEIDRLKAQMEQLQSEFKPLEKEIRGILDEMDATAERALQFGNLLVTIKKRGYEAQSVQWKPLFEELYKKVNKAMKAQMDVMKAEHTNMKSYASQIGVQRTEASLSGVWNKLKGLLTKGLNYLRKNGQGIDKDLARLKQLVNRRSEGRLKEAGETLAQVAKQTADDYYQVFFDEGNTILNAKKFISNTKGEAYGPKESSLGTRVYVLKSSISYPDLSKEARQYGGVLYSKN